MTTLDILLICVFGLCVLYDGLRGAMKSFATVAALLVAFYGGGILAKAVPLFKSDSAWLMILNHTVMSIGLFLGSFIGFRAFVTIGRLSGLKSMDRKVGVVLGVVRGVVAMTAIALVASYLLGRDKIGGVGNGLLSVFGIFFPRMVGG